MSDTEGNAGKADFLKLPELKVMREDYCSQEMTDNVARYIQEHRSDLDDVEPWIDRDPSKNKGPIIFR